MYVSIPVVADRSKGLGDLRCAEPGEVLEWMRFARSVPNGPPKSKQGALKLFCGDCTAEYREEMAKANKCIQALQAERTDDVT